MACLRNRIRWRSDSRLFSVFSFLFLGLLFSHDILQLSQGVAPDYPQSAKSSPIEAERIG